MKSIFNRTLTGLLLAFTGLLLFVGSCDVPTTNHTSINQRLSGFVSGLNGSDRSGLYQNTDSSATDYNAAKSASFWNALFPADGTYTVGTPTVSGSTITVTLNSTGTFGSASLELDTTGADNYIAVIKVGGSVIFN